MHTSKLSLNTVRSLVLLGAVLFCGTAWAQISLTGAGYTQNFDSMGTAGLTAPTGWGGDTTPNTAGAAGTTDAPNATGSAPGSATLDGANNGTGATNGEYNFGTTGSTERALGSTAASGAQRDTYVSFTNGTLSTITSLNITYDGEQWRVGSNTGSQPQSINVLTLQYSATGLTNTWVNVGSSFNFTSPNLGTGTAGALDGNANRVTGIGGTYTPSVPIAPGGSFFLRWADPDDGGNDAGMAIDNFSITIVPEPSTWIGALLAVAAIGYMQRRRIAPLLGKVS